MWIKYLEVMGTMFSQDPQVLTVAPLFCLCALDGTALQLPKPILLPNTEQCRAQAPALGWNQELLCTHWWVCVVKLKRWWAGQHRVEEVSRLHFLADSFRHIFNGLHLFVDNFILYCTLFTSICCCFISFPALLPVHFLQLSSLHLYILICSVIHWICLSKASFEKKKKLCTMHFPKQWTLKGRQNRFWRTLIQTFKMSSILASQVSCLGLCNANKFSCVSFQAQVKDFLSTCIRQLDKYN